MPPFDSIGRGEGRHLEQERLPEIRIESAIEYFKADRSALIEQLARNLQSKENRGKDMWDEVSMDDIHPKAEEALAEMEASIEENQERIRIQVKHCFDIIQRKGYRKELPELFVLVYPEGLANMIPNSEGGTMGVPGYYDPYNAWLTLDPKTPNRTIAHETGHAISHRGQDEQGWEEIGFTKMRKTEEGGGESKGFQHYDEGITTLWEEFANVDGEHIEDAGMYEWYRSLVKLHMNEAGISFDELMVANFGGGEALEEVKERIEQRFGASLEEMNALRLLALKPFALTERILMGEDIEVPFGPHDGNIRSIKQAKALQACFPNAKFTDWPDFE